MSPSHDSHLAQNKLPLMPVEIRAMFCINSFDIQPGGPRDDPLSPEKSLGLILGTNHPGCLLR